MGLDSDKVVDEFNGFLFQHTSSISLDDTVSAQKKKEADDKKVHSPYTIEVKEKKCTWPVIIIIVSVLLFSTLLYFVVSNINEAPKRVDELKSISRGDLNYEFTN